MMTPAEKKLVEFLTSEENLSCTIEILLRGNPIRTQILERFWQGLKCQLDQQQPCEVSDSMVFRFSPDDRLTDPWHVELKYLDPALEKEPQYLYYFLDTEQGKGWFGLYYGIAWGKEDNTPFKLANLDPVGALRKKLAGFKEDGGCLGWRLLHDPKYPPLPDRQYYESVDEFLASIAFLVRSPAEALRFFWSLVQETLPSVEKANRAITGKQ